MKNWKSLLLACLLPLVSQSQGTFVKLYHRAPSAYTEVVSLTMDSSVIIADSYFKDSVSLRDIRLTCIDLAGDTMWTKTIIGPNNEIPYHMIPASAGGFVVTGGSDSLGNGYNDLLLLRLDAAGDVEWSKVYVVGNSFGSSVNDGSVLQTPDGGFFVWGLKQYFISTNIAVRTDALGDTLWVKQYGNDNYLGNVSQTQDGGFIISGNDMGPMGSISNHVTRLDSAGNINWMKSYWLSIDQFPINSILPTSDGGFLFCASYGYQGFYPHVGCLIKTDAQGDTLWTRAYDTLNVSAGTGITDDLNSALELPTGDFLICGKNVLLKADQQGLPLQFYQLNIAGMDPFLQDIYEVSDGGFIASGNLQEPTTWQTRSMLMKLDSGGHPGCGYGIMTPPIANVPLTVNNIPSTNVQSMPVSIVAPMMFSTYCDSVPQVQTLCIASNIEESVVSSEIISYPNPALDHVVLLLPTTLQSASIEIFDSRGVLIHRDFMEQSNMYTYDVPSGQNGLLLVRIADGDRSYYRKVLITK